MTATPRTVASITRKGLGPRPHACDDPNLSAKEFLLAVMHDTTLPLSTRIKAARDVAPYFVAAPRPVAAVTCKIIIPPHDAFFLSSGCEPRTLKEVAKDPGQINANSQSKDEFAPNNPHASCGGPRPHNIERPSPDLSFEQILELIRTTDLDNLPLCECGHRMFFPCRPVREH